MTYIKVKDRYGGLKREVFNCEYCGKPIYFYKNRNGYKIALEEAQTTIITLDGTLDQGYQVHKPYCTDPDKHLDFFSGTTDLENPLYNEDIIKDIVESIKQCNRALGKSATHGLPEEYKEKHNGEHLKSDERKAIKREATDIVKSIRLKQDLNNASEHISDELTQNVTINKNNAKLPE